MKTGIVSVACTCILALVSFSDVRSSQPAGNAAALRDQGRKLLEKASSAHDVNKAVEMYMAAYKAYSQAKDPSSAAHTLHDIAYAYSKFGDYLKALEFYRKALAIQRQCGDLKGEMASLEAMGRRYRFLNEYKKALQAYSGALASARRLGDTAEEADLLKELGSVHYSSGNYRAGSQFIEKAIELSSKSFEGRRQARGFFHRAHLEGLLNRREKALELYTRALALFREKNDVIGMETALWGIASSYQRMGKFDKALEYYERYLKSQKSRRADKAVSYTLRSIARLHKETGHHDKALQFYRQALEIHRRQRDAMWEKFTLGDMGFVYNESGRYQKALDFFARAREVARRMGDLKGEALNLEHMGMVYRRIGLHKKAREVYAEALRIRVSARDLRGEAQCLNHMAQVNAEAGRFRKSLELLDKALAIRKKVGNASDISGSLKQIGHVYQDWGHYDRALGFYRQALDMEREAACFVCEQGTLTMMARLYESLGQYEKSLEMCETSLAKAENIGFFVVQTTAQAQTLSLMGRIYVARKEYDKALAKFEKSHDVLRKDPFSARSVSAEIGNLYLDLGEFDRAHVYLKESQDDLSLARFYLLRKDYQTARRYYQKSLQFGERSGKVDALFAACTGLGRIFEALRDYDNAEKFYKRGAEIAEQIRSGLLPSERTSFFNVRIGGFYRSEPAKGLTRIRMKQGRAAESIESGELVKARAFADNVSRRSELGYAGVPKELLDREEELVTRLARLRKGLSQTSRDTDPVRFQTLTRQILKAESDLNGFVEILWKEHTPYAAVKYPKPVLLRQAAIRPGEHIVVFDLFHDGVAVRLCEGKNVVRSSYVEWDAIDLCRQVRNFRRPFETTRLRQYDPKLGQLLYRRLLAPVLADVPKGTPLVIIPDGILCILPFEALVIEGKPSWKRGEWGDYPKGLRYLGEVYPMVYHQSITALTLARRLRGRTTAETRLLVIADPVFEMKEARAAKAGGMQVSEGKREFYATMMSSIKEASGGNLVFQRLVQTGRLAENLGKMFGDSSSILTGLQASKRVFLSTVVPEVHRYRWIVFATHGVFSTRIPGLAEPFLALTMVPPGTDGFLKMSDVMGLKLDTDAVALTACQTGLGKELSGEGVMSMGRAFHYAGARSVLMSLWSVAEKSSVILVENFFRHVKGGRNKLDALTLSRREIREMGFEHPFYWAPFILVGEAN